MRLMPLVPALLGVALALFQPRVALADDLPEPVSSMAVEKVVLLMRHGVRPPTSTAKFQVYANATFPVWDVPDGYLTGHGAQLVGLMGGFDRALYAADGLLSASGCPAAGDLFVWADNADERTRATGQALVDGMYPGCGVVAGYSAAAADDPLFSAGETVGALDVPTATAAVLAQMGGSLVPPQRRLAGVLAEMNTVLGCCSVKLCQSMLSVDSCRFQDLPAALVRSGTTALSFTGPVATGSSIAEVFELEYANGFGPSQVAFGRASSAADVRRLMKVYATKYDVYERTPYLSRRGASNIAQQMLDSVEQAAGLTTQGPPAAKLVVYVGHDTTISELGGMLGMHWSLQGFQPDDMPPGGALGFEVLRGRTGHYVRPVYLTQTLEQMHDASPLDLRHAPIYDSVALGGCEYLGGGMCSLERFVSIMTAAIDPTAVAPFGYK